MQHQSFILIHSDDFMGRHEGRILDLPDPRLKHSSCIKGDAR